MVGHYLHYGVTDTESVYNMDSDEFWDSQQSEIMDDGFGHFEKYSMGASMYLYPRVIASWKTRQNRCLKLLMAKNG